MTSKSGVAAVEIASASSRAVETTLNSLMTQGLGKSQADIRDILAEAEPTLAKINLPARVVATYRVHGIVAKSVADIAGAKLKAAAIAEITKWESTRTAAQMVSAAQTMRDYSGMQKFGALILAEFTQQAIEIGAMFEAEVDLTHFNARIGPRQDLVDRGIIDSERAESRRLHDVERAERMIRRFDDDIDEIVDRFRLLVRKWIAEIF